MIPKKIHYCWFGGNPLPKSAEKCISSWKKYFPDYEIIQWNEDNYDVYKIPYTKQAYESKKYAFVSDYARFDILYQYGGIYFDTDVEVIKSFKDILQYGSFMGCESDGESINLKSESETRVAPGLGMAAKPGMKIYEEILRFYHTLAFIKEDGTLNTETVVTYVTKILCNHGLKNQKGIQKIGEITIYSKEFFNPINNNTGKMDVTNNTHSIHWYSMSWLSWQQRVRSKLTKPFHRVFGESCFQCLKKKRI